MTIGRVPTGVIEYCLSNVGERTRRRLRAREDAVESPCLEHCGICRREPFAIVDGEFVRRDAFGLPECPTASPEGESG